MQRLDRETSGLDPASDESLSPDGIANRLLSALIEWRNVVQDLRRLAKAQYDAVAADDEVALALIVDQKDSHDLRAGALSGRVVSLEAELGLLGPAGLPPQPAAFDTTRTSLLEAMSQLNTLEIDTCSAIQARLASIRSDLDQTQRKRCLATAYSARDAAPARFFDQRG